LNLYFSFSSSFYLQTIFQADVIGNMEKVYTFLEERGQFGKEALLYEAYASFLTSEGKLVEADKIFRLGISRCIFYLIRHILIFFMYK
jgi:Mad3/BUB1 homology region 1